MVGGAAETYVVQISQFEDYVRSSLPVSEEAFLGYSLTEFTLERALKTQIQRVRAGGVGERERYKVAKPFVRFIDQFPHDAKGNEVGPVGLEPTTHGLKVRCSTN